MKTNFQMLRSFNWEPKNFGFLEEDEVSLIQNHFSIKERSDVELQNLRDFIVLFYQYLISEERQRGAEDYLKLTDTMSALTGVIDGEKVRRGMEV